jgi:hypothetical protein
MMPALLKLNGTDADETDACGIKSAPHASVLLMAPAAAS